MEITTNKREPGVHAIASAYCQWSDTGCSLTPNPHRVHQCMTYGFYDIPHVIGVETHFQSWLHTEQTQLLTAHLLFLSHA